MKSILAIGNIAKGTTTPRLCLGRLEWQNGVTAVDGVELLGAESRRCVFIVGNGRHAGGSCGEGGGVVEKHGGKVAMERGDVVWRGRPNRRKPVAPLFFT